jgi:hypothetical protein
MGAFAKQLLPPLISGVFNLSAPSLQEYFHLLGVRDWYLPMHLRISDMAHPKHHVIGVCCNACT